MHKLYFSLASITLCTSRRVCSLSLHDRRLRTHSLQFISPTGIVVLLDIKFNVVICAAYALFLVKVDRLGEKTSHPPWLQNNQPIIARRCFINTLELQ